MDIWSRLLGGAATASPAKRADLNSPQQRLLRFKKVHEQFQHIWRRNHAISKGAVPPQQVHQCLQSLKAILREEVQTSTPHLCARHVSTFNVHTNIAQLASTYDDQAILEDTLEIFKTLLDSEEGDFASDRTFADALTGYVSALCSIGANGVVEERMVEVLFAVAAKLRIQPEILPAWFRPNGRDVSDGNLNDEYTVTAKQEFPLFYSTLDYIHHEGNVGDFARTGLLYLIELSGKSAALEQWIIESDLATLMASGLGALYSQLSRKIVLSCDRDSALAIHGTSIKPQIPLPADAEITTSSAFKEHLATFLSHLVFWQDVLEHCTSVEVRNSLLDHFKFLFLQQLLYPSLIESSDIDGGSSVAVLTYLRCMIESIDHPDLVNIIFQYLLATPDVPKEEAKPQRPTTLARRRKSQSLMTNLARGQEKPLPDLFNLLDLMLTSLRSRNQQTVTATLRLVTVLLRNRHRYQMPLLMTAPVDSHQARRSIGRHEAYVASFFARMYRMGSSHDIAASYAVHLRDAQNVLETHDCAVTNLSLPDDHDYDTLRDIKDCQLRSVMKTDPLLEALTDLLTNFLANDFETNLALTQALSNLASCGNLQLDGWLVDTDRTHVQGVLHEGSARRSFIVLGPGATDNEPTSDAYDMADSESIPDVPDVQSTPPLIHGPGVIIALDSLVQQVETLRQSIQDFDLYLSKCRHINGIGDQSSMALMDDVPLKMSQAEDSELARLPRNPVDLHVSSISERLVSEEQPGSDSRAVSPRGRPIGQDPAPGLVGRLSHLRISPSSRSRSSASRTLSSSSLRSASSTSGLAKEELLPAMPPQDVHSPVRNADALQRRVKIVVLSADKSDNIKHQDTSSVPSDSGAYKESQRGNHQEVSLSHILTNVIILQEFMLELLALVQVRATLFDEVTFAMTNAVDH